MREIREIKDQLTSQDIEVLEQSLRFAIARCTHEAERGKAAENRATAMLAFLGILAGFVVPVIETVEKAQGDAKWTLLILFLASLLFIVKGLYYAVRVLGVSKVYRLEIGTVFDFQPLSREDALREEIANRSGSFAASIHRTRKGDRESWKITIAEVVEGVARIRLDGSIDSVPCGAESAGATAREGYFRR